MPALQAVIFDLDGVIVSTDEYHYLAWKQLADEEGIEFDRKINERLRGVSRMESLRIILEKADRNYSDAEQLLLAERKNNTYRELLHKLSPADILPGVMDWIRELKQHGLKVAIGSSSKNARPILLAIGLEKTFDAVVDGTDITKSKPDPEVFNLAAKILGVTDQHCLVVEDAGAGVDAALAAGMQVLAVGSATTHPDPTFKAESLGEVLVNEVLKQ